MKGYVLQIPAEAHVMSRECCKLVLPKSPLCWLQKAIESCGERSTLQTLLFAALLHEKLPLVSFLIVGILA